MSPQSLKDTLEKYRSKKARYAYLQSQTEMLERFLKICQGEMIEDQVSLSQAITGMPHGTTVGDPVSRLALDIASGKVTPFVRQIQEEMEQVRVEMRKIFPEIRLAELVLDGLKERERLMIEMKIMDDLSWAEILDRMNRKYSNSYSKRSLQRLYDRAFDKACEIVK